MELSTLFLDGYDVTFSTTSVTVDLHRLSQTALLPILSSFLCCRLYLPPALDLYPTVHISFSGSLSQVLAAPACGYLPVCCLVTSLGWGIVYGPFSLPYLALFCAATSIFLQPWTCILLSSTPSPDLFSRLCSLAALFLCGHVAFPGVLVWQSCHRIFLECVNSYCF